MAGLCWITAESPLYTGKEEGKIYNYNITVLPLWHKSDLSHNAIDILLKKCIRDLSN